MRGFQQGRGLKKQMAQDSAFAALAKDPNDPDALARLSATGPEGAQYAFGMQDRARQAAEAQRRERIRTGLMGAYDPATGRIDPIKARGTYVANEDVEGALAFDATLAKQQGQINEQEQESLIRASRLFEGATPETYPELLAAAARARIDISDLPPTFDAQAVGTIVRAGKALMTPDKDAAQFTLNPGDVRYGPDGRELVRSPYDPVVTAGGQVFERRAGAGPAAEGPPKPGDIRLGHRFKGGDTKDPANWEKVEGGQTPPASGTFRP
jgi:hypothetical protein